MRRDVMRARGRLSGRQIVALLPLATALMCTPALAQAPERPTRGGEAGQAPPPQRQPHSVVAEPRALRLGFMAPGENARGIILLRNNGDQPVIVREAKVSCKCTTVNSIAGAIIPPGGTVELQVELSGARVQGARKSSVNVVFEGGYAPLLIPIEGEVALPVRAIPPYINLIGDAPRAGRFVVEATDRKPFKLLAIDGKPPMVSGGYDPASDEARTSYIVEYDLSAVKQPDPFMLIETDRADCPILDVRVRSERSIPRGRIKLADYRLNLGVIHPGESQEFDLGLLEATELTSITAGSPDFAFEITGSEVGDKTGTAHVKVTVKETAAPGLVRFPVVVLAGSRQQEIDAFGVVRAPVAVAPASP